MKSWKPLQDNVGNLSCMNIFRIRIDEDGTRVWHRGYHLVVDPASVASHISMVKTLSDLASYSADIRTVVLANAAWVLVMARKAPRHLFKIYEAAYDRMPDDMKEELGLSDPSTMRAGDPAMLDEQRRLIGEWRPAYARKWLKENVWSTRTARCFGLILARHEEQMR